LALLAPDIGGIEEESDQLPDDSREKIFCILLCDHHQRAFLPMEYLVMEEL
jgi:hypothetical protein